MAKKPVSADDVVEALTANMVWVDHVVVVSTPEWHTCELCSERGQLAELTNHYINEHGYKLLTIGQTTEENADGELERQTISVLGRPRDA